MPFCHTKHNVTDVSNFEGLCNWHADCRNFHQSCCQIIECSTINRLQLCLENLAVRPTGLTTGEHEYGIVWASGLLISTLWTECPMVAVGLWYGISYNYILPMSIWMHKNTVMRSWGPLQGSFFKVQFLQKVFRTIDFFHILLGYSLILKWITLLLHTLPHNGRAKTGSRNVC